MVKREQTQELLSIALQDNKVYRHHDTCIILHLYYPEMWNGISSYLSNLGEQFDLFVTIPYDVDIPEHLITAKVPSAQIYHCQNRGRDVAPFLLIFSAISKLGYKYVGKIHTKKSKYIVNGNQWHEDMLRKLLGSRKIISQIKKAFDKHSDWGIIAPKGHVVPHNYFWKQNVANVLKLAHSVGIPTETLDFSFVAGSMFWFRPEALSLLLRLDLVTEDFELEQGQIDGTLAHALERFFGMVANYAGYNIAECDIQGGVKLPDVAFQFHLLVQAFQQLEQSFSTQVLELTGQVSEKERYISDLSEQLSKKERELTELTGQVSEKERHMSDLSNRISEKERELSEIYRSKSWGLIQILRRIRLWLIPYKSTRERAVFWILKAIHAWRTGYCRIYFRSKFSRLKQSISTQTAHFGRSKTGNVPQSKEDVYVPINEQDVDPLSVSVKIIAFYLPQFHPIPENDDWWGKGFTEWANVSKAFPNFRGQYQPHLPGELGFYDLRLSEVQKRQIELAKKYGIYGFCFYYYWFAGKRLLERPLDQYLADPQLNLPYCLCWANENWTRRWDGAEHEILIAQEYTEEQHLHFIRDISLYFSDPRYIRINGMPILLVYRVNLIPDAQKAAEIWRAECRKMGMRGIFLIAVQSFGIADPRSYGFDAAVEFPPSYLGEAEVNRNLVDITNPHFTGRIFDYNIAARVMAEKKHEGYIAFKTVMPSWDNTARRQNDGHIFINATAKAYKNWLSRAVKYTRKNLPEDKRFVFINAWNEWAEGTHLEPDRFHGYAYLQATAEAITLGKFRPKSTSNWSILFVSHDARKGGAQTVLLNTIAWFKKHTTISIKILCLEGGDLLPYFQELANTILLSELQQKIKSSKDDLADHLLDILDYEVPDLIYGNTVVAGKAYPWLNELGVPILTHIHEMDVSIQYYGADSIEHVLKYSSHFIACSRAVQENLVQNYGIPVDKISIGHASIYKVPELKRLSDKEKNKLKKKLKLVQNKHLIFGCGIGMPFRKGADLFIELGQILRRKGYDSFHLYWIGGFEKNARDDRYGVWSNYLKQLERGDLRDYVTFLGYKKNPRELLQLGDVYVMTSREEPFGLVALEAADCEVPTICFDNAGAAGFVGEDAGFIVPFEDMEAMAQKVIYLMENEDRRETLGMQAKEKFIDAFTVERTTPHILSACRKVAGKKPAVSIIVPNYNHAQYLPQRLKSIFDQTYQDFEVILLDDCSSDNSLEILDKYAHWGDVRLLKNGQNSGSPFRQWLKGFDLARADIWWIAESDDVSDPTFLEALLPAFDYPCVKLAYTNSHVINEKGEVMGDYLNSDYLTALSSTRWNTSYRIPAEQEVNEALGVKDTILNVSAVLFRRCEINPSIRNTLNEMRSSGDWYFIIQAIKDGEVYYDVRKLNYHRRHSESVIGKLLKSNKVENFYKEMSIVHRAVAQNYNLSASYYAKWDQYLHDQWKQFFKDRPFEELGMYYPIDDNRSRIKRHIRDESF